VSEEVCVLEEESKARQGGGGWRRKKKTRRCILNVHVCMHVHPSQAPLSVRPPTAILASSDMLLTAPVYFGITAVTMTLF
jgi:hypothetical protein